MNSLYQSMQQNSMQNQYSQFTQNPLQFIMHDPHGAVQYLLDNGQMSQAQLNRFSQIAQSMGVKL